MRADLPPDGLDLFDTPQPPAPWDFLERLDHLLDAAREPVSAFRSALAEGVAASPPSDVTRSSAGIARPTAWTASMVSSSGIGLW